MIKVKFTFSFNMIKNIFFKNLTEFRAAGTQSGSATDRRIPANNVARIRWESIEKRALVVKIVLFFEESHNT